MVDLHDRIQIVILFYESGMNDPWIEFKTLEESHARE